MIHIKKKGIYGKIHFVEEKTEKVEEKLRTSKLLLILYGDSLLGKLNKEEINL